MDRHPFDIRWFDTLESTNNYCKLLDPRSVGEFTVICARRQTAGIGQQGNVWVSEPDKNLTFSLILKPAFLAAEDQYNLTMALALAVAETLEQQLSVRRSPFSVPSSPFSVPSSPFSVPSSPFSVPSSPFSVPSSPFSVLRSPFSVLRSPFSVHIKWPNDIYVGDRKVCGILVTNQLSGGHIASSICGIGLNVNQTRFPDWVPNPTSLLLESPEHTPFDLDAVLDLLLNNIQLRYNQLRQPDGAAAIKADYLRRLYRLGIEADFIHEGQPLRATITGIDRYGHLQLTTADGATLTCAMKEIRFVI